MIKLPENIIEKLRNPKTLVILGVIGILLIFFSSFGTSEKKKETALITEGIDTEAYKEAIEADITEMVRSITGNKKVNVVVTLDSGIKYSYADTREEISSDKTEKESQSLNTELKEGYITVKSDNGGEEALLVTTQMPEIRGVAVVCEGGDNAVINEKIMNAVTAALNITSKRVYICGRN